MLTTHSKQKANEASSCPSSDAHTSPHVPVPGDHRISRRVRRRIAALQGQNVKCLTAPGRKGARQSHRPLPAARARGAGRGPHTHLGRRAAGGDPAQAGARPAVARNRQCAPRGRRVAARQGAHPAPRSGERLSGRPRLASEPACSHAATLGAPEAALCRRPPAVTPRDPPIVSSQRRRRGRAEPCLSALGAPRRPFRSLSRRRPRAAHQPSASPHRRLLPLNATGAGPAHLQPRRRCHRLVR